MKCRFFLLDLNEGRSESQPTIQLWGIDDNGKRVLIQSSQIKPYFYYLPEERETANSARERLMKGRAEFPKITAVEVETKKLLGRARDALKITCSDSQAPAAYARNIRKLLGKGEAFEEDLRLTVRYITDTDVTPSAWHECEVERIETQQVAVDLSFIAKSLPVHIENDAVPSLRILAFSILAVGERGSARPERDPVRAISVATSQAGFETFAAEGEDDSRLLTDFTALVRKFDPDIIAGYESNNTGWPYLIERCKFRKIRLTVGRDGSEPHTSAYGHVSVSGRTSLDILDVAGSMPEVKLKTIENLAKFLQIPSAGRVEAIEEFERGELWKDDTGRRALIQNTRINAQALLESTEATINYPVQLSALTGLPLDQVMTAPVGFRVDSYLIKQAHRAGELIPRKIEQPFYTYRGALVLEPKTGLHDNIVVLDFTSMYPNLMKTYNLSPDTLVKTGEIVSEDSVFVIPEVNHRFYKKPDGFYRIVLSSLIEQRKAVKEEMDGLGERSTRYIVLRERERAVKTLTNACYGYAGWAGARWYAKEVAESATALGRDVINKTIAKADSLGLQVIYGDTDSIFVVDDPKKVKQLEDWAKEEFDLDIKREHEYTRVLFTEAQKRYAGLLPDKTLDIVGLEVVRGDWSDIARQVQEQVLTRILRDQSTEKAVEDVRATIRRLRHNEVPMADLTIRKTLTKPIEDYAVRTPHVEVAKMLVKQGWDLTVGDKVAYVIAKGPGKLFQKAKPSSQVREEDVDIDYYVDNQIKPAAMRILERFGVSENQLTV
jgi:DNA polymerase I